MNKTTLVIVIVTIIILIGIGGYFYNSYINRGEPVAKQGLVITSPEENEEVSSTFRITGYVNGEGWSGFEGQVGTVELRSIQGDVIEVLGLAILTATTEWTTLPTSFETEINFNPVLATGDITLFFRNENPSGLPEKDKSFILPIKVKNEETQTVKVYFNDSNNAEDDYSCNKVTSVNRYIVKTQAIARATLEELLKGPTQMENAQGYFTSINSGVKIQSLIIENNTAKVDFDEQLEFQVGGSCRVSAIRAQITQTLKQFSSVKDVIISINGRIEDILQP